MKKILLFALIIAIGFSLKAQYDINGDHKISGKVGIGTDILDINGTSINNLVLGDGTSNSGLVINSGNSNFGTLTFANSGTFKTRFIFGNNELKFQNASNVDLLTLDDQGVLSVGMTYLKGAAGAFMSAEQLRIGRSDGDIRYHSIYSYHSSVASENYLQFRVHNGSASPYLEQKTVLSLLGDGNVGIGTTSPSEKLDIIGNIEIPGNNYYLKGGTWNYLGTSASGYGYYGMCLRYKNDRWESFHSSINGMAMKFIPNGIDFITASPNQTPAAISSIMRIKSTGDVIIGGKLTSKEVEVKVNVWSDFVFEPNYKLKTLEEVEQYIKTNKHLPDVPSEKEVKENGLSLGQSDAVLLQKIEELTLYLIEQNKENKEQSEKIKVLEDENSKLNELKEQNESLIELFKTQQTAIDELKNEIKDLKK